MGKKRYKLYAHHHYPCVTRYEMDCLLSGTSPRWMLTSSHRLRCKIDLDELPFNQHAHELLAFRIAPEI